jgi:hypothetical protein
MGSAAIASEIKKFMPAVSLPGCFLKKLYSELLARKSALATCLPGRSGPKAAYYGTDGGI